MFVGVWVFCLCIVCYRTPDTDLCTIYVVDESLHSTYILVIDNNFEGKNYTIENLD